MVAIIDYDAGNIKSVEKAVQSLGYDCATSRDREVILQADHVILPGVGSFGDAMGRLEEYDLVSVIREVCSKGIPFLGICLGLQLLFDESEESPGVKGLGLLSGSIRRLPDDAGNKMLYSGAGKKAEVGPKTQPLEVPQAELQDGISRLKVPNIGWNSLTLHGEGRLFNGIADDSFVYFVHSYYLDAADKGIVKATIDYGVTVDASIESENIFACQFHPEKSSETGFKILRNFLDV